MVATRSRSAASVPAMRAAFLPAAAATALATALATGCAATATRDEARAEAVAPQGVIAHRGASSYLPEHTLEAYSLAFGLGADSIEPDVVFTRDGVAVCAHDIVMGRVTNVAERFPDRARPDGRWYWADFTLAEVRTLRKTGDRSALDDPDDRGYGVATLAEMVAMIDRLNRSSVVTGHPADARPVGIVPELKRPGFYTPANVPGMAPGFDPVRVFVEALADAGAVAPGEPGPGVPTIVQCFDLGALERMDPMTDLPLVWLTASDPSEADLARAARFHGLGPSRRVLMDASGRPTELAERARRLGLALYPWTFKNEPEATADAYAIPGVRGVFTDNPDVARRALDRDRAPDR